MDHFVQIVMEKQEAQPLDESVFGETEILESEQGGTVYRIPLPRNLSEQEADEYADRLAGYMFSQGYDDFDIEITAEDLESADEITIEDDDDFHEWFGVIGYSDDEIAEADTKDVTLN